MARGLEERVQEMGSNSTQGDESGRLGIDESQQTLTDNGNGRPVSKDAGSAVGVSEPKDYSMFSIRPKTDDARKGVFYSNAERGVENISQNKATGEQWKNMLQKNGGLKAGEDKWLGLGGWLDERKNQPITKQEVLDYIRTR